VLIMFYRTLDRRAIILSVTTRTNISGHCSTSDSLEGGLAGGKFPSLLYFAIPRILP